MSDETKREKQVGRRDTLKLATAVSALGIGLGASLDANAAESAPGAIHMLKLDALKIDKLVLTLHKGDTAAQAVHVVDLSSFILKNEKLAPAATYFLKLTAIKDGVVVTTAIDQFSLK